MLNREFSLRSPTFSIHYSAFSISPLPPSGNGVWRNRRGHAEPCRADGDCVAGLHWCVEHLLDAAVVPRVPPGVEEAADRVELQDMLERQGDLRSHHLVERKFENRVPGHKGTDPAGSPAEWPEREPEVVICSRDRHIRSPVTSEADLVVPGIHAVATGSRRNFGLESIGKMGKKAGVRNG